MSKIGFLILILVSLTGYAKDFGVRGHVFKIEEEDILKVIARRLKEANIDELNQKLKEKTKKYVESPTPVVGVSETQNPREFFYDPTYTLKEDIKDHTGKMLYEKGHKINPLEHTSLKEHLVFIDGNNEKQVSYAINYRQTNKAKIILTKGSPLDLQRKQKIWIYFDQKGILTNKLGIKQVPAIVSQEGLRLKIQELKVKDLTFENKREGTTN